MVGILNDIDKCLDGILDYDNKREDDRIHGWTKLQKIAMKYNSTQTKPEKITIGQVIKVYVQVPGRFFIGVIAKTENDIAYVIFADRTFHTIDLADESVIWHRSESYDQENGDIEEMFMNYNQFQKGNLDSIDFKPFFEEENENDNDNDDIQENEEEENTEKIDNRKALGDFKNHDNALEDLDSKKKIENDKAGGDVKDDTLDSNQSLGFLSSTSSSRSVIQLASALCGVAVTESTSLEEVLSSIESGEVAQSVS